MQTQIYRWQPNKQRLNNMLEWVKKQFEVREVELGNILRWEDDGGQIAGDKTTTIAQPLLPAQGVTDKKLH